MVSGKYLFKLPHRGILVGIILEYIVMVIDAADDGIFLSFSAIGFSNYNAVVLRAFVLSFEIIIIVIFLSAIFELDEA